MFAHGSPAKGKFFNSYDSKGRMLRRGWIVRKCAKTFVVALVEAGIGIFVGETRRVAPSQMKYWRFFNTVEEANADCDDHFRNKFPCQ
jgi:hypothetical protein